MNKVTKYNPFSPTSPLYAIRRFIIFALVVAVFMTWHDLRGGRMFKFNSNQSWEKKGPGYHK